MFLGRLASITLRNKMLVSLYEKYLVTFIVADNNKIELLGTGKTNNIIWKGVDHWAQRLIDVNWSFFEIFVGIVVALGAIIFQIWWLWGWIAGILFALSALINQFGNKLVANLRIKKRDIITQIDRGIIKIIMSKLEILQNQKIHHEMQKLKNKFNETKELSIKENYKRIWSVDLQQLTFIIIQIWLLLIMWRGVYNGKYTIGTISMVRMLINQINNRTWMFNTFMTDYYQSMVFIEKLRDTFDKIPQILGYEEWIEFVFKNWDIVFENVSYKYDQSEIVKKLNLHIEGGKKTAFVGVSGSGKSTLIKLIWWYLHATSGRVLIDDQPLPAEGKVKKNSTIALKTYYPSVGYLTQEPNVFDWTVRENLLYGASEQQITEEQINQSLKDAQCNFVFALKDGIDTEIGEKGVRLSGWERQRLAIAKIMLKNPRIVLLDEPTSALDSFSEEEVTKALSALFIWRTVVIIAHRLQTVKNADEIIVLQEWSVIERWTHKELAQKKSIYAHMLELQSWF